MARSTFYVKADGGFIIEYPRIEPALDYAEKFAERNPDQIVTVSDDRGRVLWSAFDGEIKELN